MVRRYFVPTRLLQEGMKIDQSIVDGTNRVLIARSTVLDDFMIKGLRKLGISGVYIREGEEEGSGSVGRSDLRIDVMVCEIYLIVIWLGCLAKV